MGPILGGSPKVRFDPSSVNMMFEGNSLVAGYGSTAGNSLPEQLQRLAPLNGISVKNFGVGGSTWQALNSMTARASAVDAWYVPGKTNILFLWEGTNTICNDATLSAVDVGLQTATYIAARKAAHPGLKIILLNTIPRIYAGAGRNVVDANTVMVAYNDYLQAHYREMGVDILIDTRATGIFIWNGTQYMAPVMAPYIMDNVHCNDGGYALVAQMCAPALTRLRK